MKTAQEIFEEVSKALIAQGEPCIDKGNCKYRHVREDGKVLKCAVGFLIPDHLYDVRMENMGVTQLIGDVEPFNEQCSRNKKDIAHKLNEFRHDLIPHILLLSDLQRAHDKWDAHANYYLDRFNPLINNLIHIAARHSLDASFLPLLVKSLNTEVSASPSS
jgi:hypothetical protein